MALTTGNSYLSILILGEMFRDAYKERGLAAKNLSRTLEDAGTVVVPLIPWSAAAAYMASTLGVETWITFRGQSCATLAGFLQSSGALPDSVSQSLLMRRKRRTKYFFLLCGPDVHVISGGGGGPYSDSGSISFRCNHSWSNHGYWRSRTDGTGRHPESPCESAG